MRPASKKGPAKEKGDLDADDEDLFPLVPPRPPLGAPVRKRKRPQYGRTKLLHWNMWYPMTRVSEQKIQQFWAEKQKVKPYVTS